MATRTIELYDPASPDRPRVDLAVNFDPRIHVRWTDRPGAGGPPAGASGVSPFLERACLSAGLTKQAFDSLEEAGVADAGDVIELGRDGLLALDGVGPKTADALLELAGGEE